MRLSMGTAINRYRYRQSDPPALPITVLLTNDFLLVPARSLTCALMAKPRHCISLAAYEGLTRIVLVTLIGGRRLKPFGKGDVAVQCLG